MRYPCNIAKRWLSVIEVESEKGPEVEAEIVLETNDEDPSPTSNSNQRSDVFFVKRILKHKYSQGWKFLVHWEGFPIASSKWEPIDHSFSMEDQ